MPHKRGFEARQRRAAKRLIIMMAYRDKFRAETVNKLDRSHLVDYISKMFDGRVELGAIPMVEVGEALYDSRGKGSLQRRSDNEG